MNYTCLIYGGTMLFALLYYAFSGRKWFKGPRVNVEVTFAFSPLAVNSS